MDAVGNYIHKKIVLCDSKDRVVTLSEVEDAVRHLKSNKSDGDKGFMSNHLLNGSEALYR